LQQYSFNENDASHKNYIDAILLFVHEKYIFNTKLLSHWNSIATMGDTFPRKAIFTKLTKLFTSIHKNYIDAILAFVHEEYIFNIRLLSHWNNIATMGDTFQKKQFSLNQRSYLHPWAWMKHGKYGWKLMNPR